MKTEHRRAMAAKAKQTEFEQFLEEFAGAVELAVAGELDEALDSLEEGHRRARIAAGGDQGTLMAVLYRYDTARKVLSRRHSEDG